jgi:hypothetical protein
MMTTRSATREKLGPRVAPLVASILSTPEEAPEPQPYIRRRRRITDTNDLIATLRRSGQPTVVAAVINLSETGLGVFARDLRIGDVLALDLSGGFHASGIVEVSRIRSRTTGLRIIGWDGEGARRVENFLAERQGDGRRGARGVALPGVYLG